MLHLALASLAPSLAHGPLIFTACAIETLSPPPPLLAFRPAVFFNNCVPHSTSRSVDEHLVSLAPTRCRTSSHWLCALSSPMACPSRSKTKSSPMPPTVSFSQHNVMIDSSASDPTVDPPNAQMSVLAIETILEAPPPPLSSWPSQYSAGNLLPAAATTVTTMARLPQNPA